MLRIEGITQGHIQGGRVVGWKTRIFGRLVECKVTLALKEKSLPEDVDGMSQFSFGS